MKAYKTPLAKRLRAHAYYHTHKAQALAAVYKWHQAHPNYGRDYQAKRRLDPEFRERQRLYYERWYTRNGRKRPADYIEKSKIWHQTHKEARRARDKLYRAIRRGKVDKPVLCSLCKVSKRLGAHHEDYTKPLDVMWLCASCHKLWHYHHPNKKEATLPSP